MPRDWHLAEETSWWGRALDPRTFWEGRVVWLDESSISSARRHGRAYPPPPYVDPSLPSYVNNNDVTEGSGGIEGPSLHLHWTPKERAFWERFTRTHPKPPEMLE